MPLLSMFLAALILKLQENSIQMTGTISLYDFCKAALEHYPVNFIKEHYLYCICFKFVK